ncbi:MAG: lipopolysaccharide kinase InaA family protein, partial [Longimicrobiales bacterium]
LEGRAATYHVDAPGGAWVVRHYHRGGAVARLLGDRYMRLGVTRPVRELHASDRARARGVRTPRVIAIAIRNHGVFYRADIATEYIPDSADLAEVTFGVGRWHLPHAPAPALSLAVQAWDAAGTLVRDAARAGVVHGDLNLKNILIAGRSSSPRAWLIDLDGCRIRGTDSSGRHLDRMLSRFDRSRRKFERITGRRVQEAELNAFRDAVRG